MRIVCFVVFVYSYYRARCVDTFLCIDDVACCEEVLSERITQYAHANSTDLNKFEIRAKAGDTACVTCPIN